MEEVNHTPSTEEREELDKIIYAAIVAGTKLGAKLDYKSADYETKVAKIEEIREKVRTRLLVWNQSTAKASEASVIEARIDELESLRFCLDEETRKVHHSQDGNFRFGTVRERLAELRQALNLDQEREE